MFKWIRDYFRKRAYKKYIASKEWRSLRDAVKKRDGYECFVCDAGASDQTLEVHHLYYPDNLYKSKPYQCITLCRPCHRKIHKRTQRYLNKP